MKGRPGQVLRGWFVSRLAGASQRRRRRSVENVGDASNLRSCMVAEAKKEKEKEEKKRGPKGEKRERSRNVERGGSGITLRLRNLYGAVASVPSGRGTKYTFYP